MRLRLEIALLCIINIVWIPHALCDGNSTNSKANKWECDCFSEQFSVLSAYCLESCNCTIVTQYTWTCICPGDGMPRLASEDNDWSCFSTCNCEAGESESKGMSTRTALLIFFSPVLVCVAICGGVLIWLGRKHPPPGIDTSSMSRRRACLAYCMW